jgi:hypothetical protein
MPLKACVEAGVFRQTAIHFTCFNHQSTSLTDFWSRRWNITTSMILRTLVFDPVSEGERAREAREVGMGERGRRGGEAVRPCEQLLLTPAFLGCVAGHAGVWIKGGAASKAGTVSTPGRPRRYKGNRPLGESPILP